MPKSKENAESKSAWEQLLALRAATVTVGALHEAQKLQLKMWGPLALPHADKITVAVGINDDESVGPRLRLVEYRCKITKKAPKLLKKRLEGLARSIKAMLGEDFVVVVKNGQKTIFKAEAQELQRAKPKYESPGSQAGGS